MQVLIGTPAEVVEVLNGLEKIEEKQKSEKDLFTRKPTIFIDGKEITNAIGSTYL